MQLTRFDRWLRVKFVYELHIHTLRPPESIPCGIRVVDLHDTFDTRYKHHYIASSDKAANTLIQQLKDNNQMYTTKIVDRHAWYTPFIAPKEKSVTWWIFSLIVILISVYFALIYIKSFVDDPEFRKNFMEAMKLFKG